MKTARRLSRIFFFLLMFIIPVLNIFGVYFIKGTYISLDVGTLSVSDPLAVLQAAFASHTVVPVMLVSVAVPVLVAIFFGRVWCSWCCPYSSLMDIFDILRKKLKLKSLKPKYDNAQTCRANMWRFALLIFGFVLVGVTGVPLLYLFSPPSLMSAQSVMLLKYFTLTAEFAVLLIIVIVDFFIGYRFWCRYVCPTGTVLSVCRTRFGLHIEYSGTCSMCGKCVRVCPMVLDPKKDGLSSACNNCGVCVLSCVEHGDNALKFKIR